MSQLMLNNCRIKVQLFVKNCPSHRTEAVAGDLCFCVISHATECSVDSCLAHGLFWIATWKDIASASGKSMQFPQDGDRLGG